VDKAPRGEPGSSDHAPVWIILRRVASSADPTTKRRAVARKK